jgi:hypothetical protein
MRVTQITTHEEDALNRLLYQYKGKENLGNLIKDLYTTSTQGLEDGLFQLYGRLNIDTSLGIQLDNIGTIVGQSRLGLPDTTYRLFLKAKIGANVSEGDIPRVIDVWRLITGSNIIQLLEAFPAEVDLYYDIPLDDDLTALAFALIQNVVGAGIAVGFLAVYDPIEGFTLDDDVVGDDGTIDILQGLGGALSQGANTSVSANKLIDNTATFQSDLVDDTMKVYNTSDNTESKIASVDSEIQLTLDGDIFAGSPKEYYVNENTGGKLAYLQAP